VHNKLIADSRSVAKQAPLTDIGQCEQASMLHAPRQAHASAEVRQTVDPHHTYLKNNRRRDLSPLSEIRLTDLPPFAK
jgi:hypothetical protein